MKAGVLGSGVVGQVLATGFLKHGHAAMLGTRDPQKPEAQNWLQMNPGGAVGLFQDAAVFGEIIVLATAGRVAESALELAGVDNLAGKTLIDATNPLDESAPPTDGVLRFTTGPNESLGERVQAKAPQAHVVKAFNSVGNAHMVNPSFKNGPPTMFIGGNSGEAKKQVSEILRQFGWEPFDCGGIIAARAIEPLCMLWCIPVFLRGQSNHAFRLLTK
jgi:predicted dinucleotide-binding enzyme